MNYENRSRTVCEESLVMATIVHHAQEGIDKGT